jgi:hypothetical protein
MTELQLSKLLEIQYLKGRLDELYKGYVPTNNSSDNRMVDIRISKYEDKLKEIDIVAYHIDMIERKNRYYAKKKSKKKIFNLLATIKSLLTDEGLNKHQSLVDKIQEQLNTYKL